MQFERPEEGGILAVDILPTILARSLAVERFGIEGDITFFGLAVELAGTDEAVVAIGGLIESLSGGQSHIGIDDIVREGIDLVYAQVVAKVLAGVIEDESCLECVQECSIEVLGVLPIFGAGSERACVLTIARVHGQ